jgi:hypothetical protein
MRKLLLRLFRFGRKEKPAAPSSAASLTRCLTPYLQSDPHFKFVVSEQRPTSSETSRVAE